MNIAIIALTQYLIGIISVTLSYYIMIFIIDILFMYDDGHYGYFEKGFKLKDLREKYKDEGDILYDMYRISKYFPVLNILITIIFIILIVALSIILILMKPIGYIYKLYDKLKQKILNIRLR